MNEYLALSWSWNKICTPQECDEYYNRFEVSEDETDVFYCHLNEIDLKHILPFADSSFEENSNDSRYADDILILTDPRTKRRYEPNFIFHHSINTCSIKSIGQLNATSSLTIDEHLACLRCIEKLFVNHRQFITNLEDLNEEQQNDFEIWNLTKEKRLKEKQHFMDIVHSRFITIFTKRHHDVHLDFEKFNIDIWKKNIDRLTSNKQGTRKLKGLYVIKSAVTLQYSSCHQIIRMRDCVQSKSIQCGVVPLFDSSNLDKTTFKKSYDALKKFYEKINNIDLDECKMQLENNIEIYLANENHDTIIIDELSLLTFLTSTITQNSWIIEVSIREGHHSNKLIFIENRLPPHHLSCIERHHTGYKYSILLGLCVMDINKCYSLNTKQINMKSKTIAKPKNNAKVLYEVQKFNEYLEFQKSVNHTSNCVNNCTYRNWKLEECDTNNNVNLLICTKYDGYHRAEDTDEIQFINLSIKLEFQSDYGYEQMTEAELIGEWCRQYIKPNSITQRIRICVASGKVLSTKYLHLIDVENELNYLYNIKPDSLIQKLWGILNPLKKFPNNEYLLKCDGKSDKALVLEKSNISNCELQKNPLDMNTIYQNINFEKSTSNAITLNQLDECELMDVHKNHHVLPCAFSPYSKISIQNHQPKKNDDVEEIKVTSFNDRATVIQRELEKIETKKMLLKKYQKERKNKLQRSKRIRQRAQKVIKLNNNSSFKHHNNIEIIDPTETFHQNTYIHIANYSKSITNIQNIDDQQYHSIDINLNTSS